MEARLEHCPWPAGSPCVGAGAQVYAGSTGSRAQTDRQVRHAEARLVGPCGQLMMAGTEMRIVARCAMIPTGTSVALGRLRRVCESDGQYLRRGQSPNEDSNAQSIVPFESHCPLRTSSALSRLARWVARGLPDTPVFTICACRQSETHVSILQASHVERWSCDLIHAPLSQSIKCGRIDSQVGV